MTVKELKEELNQYDNETEVYIRFYDGGWNPLESIGKETLEVWCKPPWEVLMLRYYKPQEKNNG